MNNVVVSLPEFAKEPPKQVQRPCDASLFIAVTALETQLGTVEAYNRICQAAEVLFSKIKQGKAQPCNPCYAASIKGDNTNGDK